ncbi:leukocyte surface antigen CD53-like [Zootermopsis nevadensis]|uniref:leukocyte surface antigen CD53-like n=1 Tax=Zootermopsis nevadensis TaxID=136037 RepID=UPI000B8E36A2|nr:leukocyte surface antigen CD53-like [Zootermopsis nevadensis]
MTVKVFVAQRVSLLFIKTSPVFGNITMKIYQRELLRCMHILFCLVILVLRAGLLYLAVSIRERLFNFNAFLYDYVTVLVFYLITSSSVFIVVSAVGICAAVTFRRRFFVAYSAILAVLYLAEIVLFGIAFNGWLNFNATVEEAMDYHISNYRNDSRDIDYVQEELRCCGKHREDEWFDTLAYIPVSCCPSRPPTDTQDFCSLLPPDISFIIHNTGCLKRLQEMPLTGIKIITSILIGVCAVEVLSFCASTYAIREIGTVVSTKNVNITREYELTKKSEKNINIYNEKQNNTRKAEVLFQCNARKGVHYVHKNVNQLTDSGPNVKHTK